MRTAAFFPVFIVKPHALYMRPSLWGPTIWRIMLSCTWNVSDDLVDVVQRFLLVLVPEILPCTTCADHYRRHITTVNRKARGRPGGGDHSFRWCWYMKNEVNLSLSPPVTSIHLADLAERYLLHGAVLPHVEAADVLVLCAIQARNDSKDDVFVEFCASIATLLREDDSVFLHYLKHIQRPIIPTTLRLARFTREAHGLPRMDLLKYRETVR